MIVFDCAVCRTKLRAEVAQAGAWVLCPTCRSKLLVPQAVGAAQSAPAAAQNLEAMVGAGSGASGAASGAEAGGGMSAPPPPVFSPPRPSIGGGGFRSANTGGKRYGFNCGYCSSRLEATEAMAAQDGQCPTCGNSITIPIQDRYGRLIDPKTRQIIKQDPHPVHAYAAAGDRAPAILRQGDGKQIIRCPRCSAASPITANNCKACGMPFTMEGTTLEAAGNSNGFAVAGLVLGIIGLPASCLFVPSVLALIFSGVAYSQISKQEGGNKGMAIAGLILGGIGCLIGFYWQFWR